MRQSVADGNLAVVQGVVLAQVAAAEGAGLQQQQFGGEQEGSEKAKNALE